MERTSQASTVQRLQLSLPPVERVDSPVDWRDRLSFKAAPEREAHYKYNESDEAPNCRNIADLPTLRM